MPRTPRTMRRASLLALAAVLVVTASCTESPPEEQPIGGPAPDRTSAGATGETPDPETGHDTDSGTTSGQAIDPTELEPLAGELTVTETIATGLHTPWDVDFLDDGSALVSLRDTGEVLRIAGGAQTVLQADGPGGAIPGVEHESEDGLLGLAVGPEGGVYLYLSTSSDNRVVRGDPNPPQPLRRAARVRARRLPLHHHG